jgi:hypothetical protein
MVVKARERLMFGRDSIESEQTGTIETKMEADGSIAVTITVSPGDLERELIAGGILLDAEELDRFGDHRDRLLALATERVEAFCATSPEQLRVWLTATLAWDAQVRRMTPEHFLTWLSEFPPRNVPRVLSVPAVQEQIAAIRKKGPQFRKKLADVLSVRHNGRPLGVPADWVVAAKVRSESARWEPLHREIDGATVARRFEVWASIKQHAPQLATELEQRHCRTPAGRESLRTLWFEAGQAPSLYQMACQSVAANDGLSWTTVEKASGRVRAARNRKKAKHFPDHAQQWRKALLALEQAFPPDHSAAE